MEWRLQSQAMPLPEPHIGLSSETREKTSEILRSILADQHVLYIKTRNFHWNLIGGRFHSLHEFFEEQYIELAETIDETAERIRMIGGVSPGSMKEFLELASLNEVDGELVNGDAAIDQLRLDHEQCITALRSSIATIDDELGDVGSADFLTEVLQKHEMTAWTLRSYLESTAA